MFYIACEILEKPELKDKPCAVGSMQMLSTSNYVARKYGVRSAMPGFIAKELCPELIILPLNFKSYKKKSEKMMEVVKDYGKLESHGMDEVQIDIT